MDNTVGSLTQLEKSVIVGSLFGDGYLRIVPGRLNALLEINHTIHQKEYVDWKYQMLKSICKSAPVARRGNGRRIAYRFNTKQHPGLTALHKLFYVNGKKHIPDNITINPLGLAVWYMDDGSKCSEDNFYLNTQQFDLAGQNNCMKILSRFGIESSINRDKIYYRVRVKKSSVRKLVEVINPYIIPSMKYKLSYNPVETYSERNRVEVFTSANTPTPDMVSG